MKWAYKYIDKQILTFLIKFGLLFGLFYALTYGFIGITVPGGLYWEFAAVHLNYVVAFRSFLLHAAGVVISLFGYKYIVSGYCLYVVNGTTLRMVYSCIGFGILSFWWAFVIAFPQTRASKVRYFIWGTILIIAMNIARLSALAIIYTRYTKQYRNIDHHLIFDICVYGVLFFMIYRWLNLPSSEAGYKQKKVQ